MIFELIYLKARSPPRSRPGAQIRRAEGPDPLHTIRVAASGR